MLTDVRIEFTFMGPLLYNIQNTYSERKSNKEFKTKYSTFKKLKT